MQLFWKNNTLIYNNTQYEFISNIKKVLVFNKEPVVLTHTLIFIDSFPYSPFDCKIPFNTKIKTFKNNFNLCNALNLEEQVRAIALNNQLFYQQQDSIYSLTHKYAEPVFLLQCKYELLDVTEMCFLFKNNSNLLLRSRIEEIYFCCRFNCPTGFEIQQINEFDSFEIENLKESKSFNNLENEAFDMNYQNVVNSIENEYFYSSELKNCNFPQIKTSQSKKDSFNLNNADFQDINLDFQDINLDLQSNFKTTNLNALNFYRIKNIILISLENKIIFFNLKNFNFEIKNQKIYNVGLCKYENIFYFLINNEIFDENLTSKIIELEANFLLSNGFSTNYFLPQIPLISKFEKKLVRTHNPLSFIKKNISKLNDLNYIRAIQENYLAEEIKEKNIFSINPIKVPMDFKGYLSKFDQKQKEFTFYAPENDFLKKSIRIKKDLKIRKRIFTEFPNLIKFQKLSSLNYYNLSKTHKEAILLCFEEPQTFLPDENDLENRKGKIYKLKKSVQSSFILYGCLKPSFSGIGFNGSLVRILITDLENKINTIGNKIELERSIISSEVEFNEDHFIYNIVNQKNNKIFTKLEIAGLILGLGIRKSYLQAYSTTDNFISSISLIASSITNEGKKDESLLMNLSSNNLIQRSCTLIALSYSYKATGSFKIIRILINEANQFGSVNKDWYDIFYRLIAGFSIINLHKKQFNGFTEEYFSKYFVDSFIDLQDKLVELIVNGILFFNSNNTKIIKKLQRNNQNRLEEVFYSEIFINGISNTPIDLPILEENLNDYEIYKIAGKYFYIGIYHLFNSNLPKDSSCILEKGLTTELIKNCSFLEEIMISNPSYKIIFDTILIALSIINNGTSDFSVLKLLRKAINLQGFNRNIDFVCGKYETNYFLRYGDYLKYKMCIGLLCCGLSNFQLSRDCLLELIYAFYLDFPFNEEDQKIFNFFRNNLSSKFVRKDIVKGDWKDEDKKVLFDLYANLYEKNGEEEFALDEFC